MGASPIAHSSSRHLYLNALSPNRSSLSIHPALFQADSSELFSRAGFTSPPNAPTPEEPTLPCQPTEMAALNPKVTFMSSFCATFGRQDTITHLPPASCTITPWLAASSYPPPCLVFLPVPCPSRPSCQLLKLLRPCCGLPSAVIIHSWGKVVH